MRRAILVAIVLQGAWVTPARAQSEKPCRTYATAQSRAACDAAIADANEDEDKASLLYERGYAKVDNSDINGALGDFNLALMYNPEFAAALHERAYVFNELGEYELAAIDLTAQLELRPGYAKAHLERAYSRFYSGDLKGSYDDRKRYLELKPDDSVEQLGQARLAAWLGRFDEARTMSEAVLAKASETNDEELKGSAAFQIRAITQMRDATPGGVPADLCLEADKSKAYLSPHLIGDCTAAFQAASDPRARADFLTARGLAWLYGQKSAYLSLDDMRLALAFDPSNPDRYFNAGSLHLQRGEAGNALRQFNRAIAKDRSWYALGGRASAKYQLKDFNGAFDDATASLALKLTSGPLVVLGDLAIRQGETDKAKQSWLGAYKLGWKDESLLERLKRVGVADPEREN